MTIKDNDTVERSIRKQLNNLKNAHIEIGIRSGDLAADGSSIVHYATINEFGAGDIPERSFIRSTADEKKKKWGGLAENVIAGILDSTPTNTKVALSRIGVIARDDIKDKISSGVKPENASSTKLKKGGSVNAKTTTLIDTGAMRQAVNYTIVGL